MRFLRDPRGSVGAQKSLLVLVALGVLLLVAGLVRMGAQHAASEAKKELEQKVGNSGDGEPVVQGGHGNSGNPGVATSVFSAATNPLETSLPGPVPSLGVRDSEEGGGTYDPGDKIRHDAVVLYFATVIRPGSQTEVPIPGSGEKGGTGRADVVNGKEIWEVKPARSWWMDGTGEAQLNRYVKNRQGSIPGEPYDEPFTLPDPTDPTKELVVQSYEQRGMLYYYSRKITQPQPDPKPVPVPVPVAVPAPDDESVKKAAAAAAAAAGGGALLWWLGKLASPACGPAVVVCAIIF